MITFFTDTDCDVNLNDAKRLNFKLISMPYTLSSGEVFPYEDYEEFNSHEFYDLLRNGETPKTSGLSPDRYIKYFEPEFEKGNDIFYTHFSSKMSSTFNSMELAINELKEKYPDRKFYSLDTLAITGLARAIVEEVAVLRDKGIAPEEIIKIINKDVLQHYSLAGYANDLDFFKRSGRLNNAAAFFGKLVHAKPIICIDEHGKMGAFGKEIGKKNALRKIILIVEELGDEIDKHFLFITHSDCLELVEIVKNELNSHFKKELNFKVIDLNPTAGVHSGPSCIGVIFHSKRRIL